VTTRLFAVRHGESTSNVHGIATSALEGYPLTARGRRQAAAAGRELAGRGVERVYASRIQRARQTARVVAAEIGAPLTVVAGLEEIDVGLLEGRSDGDVQTSAVANFERWLSHDDLDHGFDGGETAREALTRGAAALTDLAARHPDGTVAVVSHGGVLALSLIHLCHNVTSGFVRGHLLDNCAVVEVAVAGGEWTCTAWAGTQLPAPDVYLPTPDPAAVRNCAAGP
jgi:probable phosphoglycerate mutase